MSTEEDLEMDICETTQDDIAVLNLRASILYGPEVAILNRHIQNLIARGITTL